MIVSPPSGTITVLTKGDGAAMGGNRKAHGTVVTGGFGAANTVGKINGALMGVGLKTIGGLAPPPPPPPA
jgi:hypothetical protein